MKLLSEYIREMLKEQNVLAQGVCFPFAYQKAEEWFEDHFTPGARGRSPKRHPNLNDKSKFKVVHGTVTDKWKRPPKPVVHGWVEMGDLVFDDQTKHMKPNGVEKEFYYDTYQPEIKKEFTAEEAITNCIRYGGEGPWDDELYATLLQRDKGLQEKVTREKGKKKRTLYHIGKRPASPKPKMRWFSEWDDEAEDKKTGEPTGESVTTGPDQAWVRSWMDRPVESGVFMTTNAFGIAKNHGIYGNVYAYKVPEWVIKKSGGLHRYDYGSEVLIPEDVWHEAEKEIEFMGKSLSRQELSKKLSSSDAWDTPLRRSRRGSMKKPGWISDEDWEATQKFTSQKRILQGLRATKHLKSAIKMMTQPEAEEALAVFEKVHEEQPPEIVKGPRDKKGIVVPWFDRGPPAQDKEIMALLKKHMNESMVREAIRSMISDIREKI